MKGKLLVLMATLGVTALTFFALITSASACYAGAYQPEEPNCLREE